ncbi:MAG TPA: HIT domain-containing protein [Candidatus Kapabacteria bacterium]|jgi:ATP adenylyltransferase|nr:HIT domain-containing protein [Candidatus Kapabacteria bacterium]
MENLYSPWRSHYIQSFKGEKPTGCVFCSAREGQDDEETMLVYRGETAFVLMNRFPYNSGHLMVIPNRHSSDFQSLTEQEALECVQLLQASQRALLALVKPHAFNLGMNLGRTAGAGIDDHFHWHIVPRWDGDTNFLPVLSDVKLVSEDMHRQWGELHKIFPTLIGKT